MRGIFAKINDWAKALPGTTIPSSLLFLGCEHAEGRLPGSCHRQMVCVDCLLAYWNEECYVMLAKTTRAHGRAFFRQHDMLCTWHLRAGLWFQGLGFGMLSWFGGRDGEEVDVTYLLSYN